MPNNSNFFLNNYSGEDLFAFCDPSQIADLDMNSVDETADFTMTQNGALAAKVYKKVPDDVSLSLRASDLKQKNKSLYNDLLKAGKDLGTANWNAQGIGAAIYKVSVSIPLVLKGNPAAFSSVGLKIVKQ